MLTTAISVRRSNFRPPVRLPAWPGGRWSTVCTVEYVRNLLLPFSFPSASASLPLPYLFLAAFISTATGYTYHPTQERDESSYKPYPTLDTLLHYTYPGLISDPTNAAALILV